MCEHSALLCCDPGRQWRREGLCCPSAGHAQGSGETPLFFRLRQATCMISSGQRGVFLAFCGRFQKAAGLELALLDDFRQTSGRPTWQPRDGFGKGAEGHAPHEQTVGRGRDAGWIVNRQKEVMAMLDRASRSFCSVPMLVACRRLNRQSPAFCARFCCLQSDCQSTLGLDAFVCFGEECQPL